MTKVSTYTTKKFIILVKSKPTNWFGLKPTKLFVIKIFVPLVKLICKNLESSTSWRTRTFSMRAKSMPDGVYDLGGQNVIKKEMVETDKIKSGRVILGG